MVVRRSGAAAACLFLSIFSAAAAGAAVPLLERKSVTPDASAELAQICPHGTGYPLESGWASAPGSTPHAAISGQPHIEQFRNGKHLATYASFVNRPSCRLSGDGTDYLNPEKPAATGCGPFTREYTYRLWAPGDVFYVYPAVYDGEYNQPWIGPAYDSYADYVAGISHAPDNITIQGVVQDNARPVIVLDGAASNNTLGQAPVYFDQSNGVVWDSIDVVAGSKAVAGKAGVYELAGSNLTLSNMRISDFEKSDVNGLFGAGQYSGVLTLTSIELDHNGGRNGPAHNAYIGASQVDPGFTVNMSRSWSHHAFYGHLFKSRAQNNVFTANYFQGGLPQMGRTQAETYLLDIPNGGQTTVRNNIFVKNRSGAGANAMSFTFLLEGAVDSRPQSVDLENNIFVTFAKTYDGSHTNFPMALLYPNVVPGTTAWPAGIPARIMKNAFVGYCTGSSSNAAEAFRGDIAVVESFGELTRTYALRTKLDANDAALDAIYPDYVPEIGTPSYAFRYGATPSRHLATIGAQD